MSVLAKTILQDNIVFEFTMVDSPRLAVGKKYIRLMGFLVFLPPNATGARKIETHAQRWLLNSV